MVFRTEEQEVLNAECKICEYYMVTERSIFVKMVIVNDHHILHGILE